MRRAARVIVIKDNQLLVMHRNKFGEEYDSLPGGNVEIGETPEQAAVRELADETQVTVTNLRLVFLEHSGDPYGDQYIYLADYAAGEPVLKPGSEEELISRLGKNLYQPLWRPLDALAALPFKTERLKATILQATREGWPATPIELG